MNFSFLMMVSYFSGISSIEKYRMAGIFPMNFSFLIMSIVIFQASVALKSIEWQENYPMDYYSSNSLGSWTVNNEANRPARPKRSAAATRAKLKQANPPAPAAPSEVEKPPSPSKDPTKEEEKEPCKNSCADCECTKEKY